MSATFAVELRTTRQQRKARANLRVTTPIDRPVRDPLARPDRGPIARMSKGAVVLIAAAVVHAIILLGFIAANAISRAFAEPEAVEPEQTAVTMVDQPEAEPEVDQPPPEPDPEPLPRVESFELAIAPVQDAPQIGISADSTIEGGTGPAFQIGTTLAGPSVAGGLAREILGKETAPREEMVMTAEAVDVQPRQLGSNRPPAPPGAAVRKRVSGFVVVQLVIDEDGSVRETKVLQSQPAGFFDDAVLEVAPSWRFTPATYQGRAVTTRVEQTIRFDLG